MERNTLHGNHLGSPRNLGLTASPDREHSATQGQTGSGMRVEQVKNKVSKEALQGLIAQAGDLNDKPRLKDFVIQHVPSGKDFNVIYGQLKNSKTFHIDDIAALYADNKDAADAAYESIVSDKAKFSHKTRKEALSSIINPGKRHETRLDYLLSLGAGDVSQLKFLIESIEDPVSRKNTCCQILPHFLAWKNFLARVLDGLNGVSDNEKDQILYGSIEKSQGIDFKNSTVLAYIKNVDLKRKAEELIAVKQKASEDHLYQDLLACLKDPKIELQSKLSKISTTPLPIRDTFYAILSANNLLDKDLALAIASRIKDYKTKAETYGSILDGITDDAERVNLFHNLFIKELKLNPEQLANMFRYDHRLYTTGTLCKHFLNHNLPELVVKAMNAPIEGLESDVLEGVKKTKLAAARAVLNLDNENIDALTTILALEAQGADSPYNIYQTVVEKSKESVSLEELLDKKKEQLAGILANGQKVCLSAGAYALPAVMNAEWQEGFETVDFAYFTGVIQAVFEDCRAEIERGLNKTDDIAEIERLKEAIKENKTLEGDYLKYFNEDGRSVLQNALNTKNGYC